MQLFFLGCWNEIKCDKDNRAIILDKILNAGYKIGVLGGDNFYPYKVGKKDLELTDGKPKLFRKSTLRPLEKLHGRIDDLHVVLGNHDLDKLPESRTTICGIQISDKFIQRPIICISTRRDRYIYQYGYR